MSQLQSLNCSNSKEHEKPQCSILPTHRYFNTYSMLFVKTHHCRCWPLVGHFTVVCFHGCPPLQHKSCICFYGSSVWGDSVPCGFSKKRQIITGNRASFQSFWLWSVLSFIFLCSLLRQPLFVPSCLVNVRIYLFQ